MKSQNESRDAMIARGVSLAQQRMSIDMQIRILNTLIEDHFPGTATREVLEEASGSAERTVCREWWIKSGHLRDVRRILSQANLLNLLDEEMPLTVTASLRALLKNDRSDIGVLLRPHVVVVRTVRYVYHDALSNVLVGDGIDSEVVDFTGLREE